MMICKYCIYRTWHLVSTIIIISIFDISIRYICMYEFGIENKSLVGPMGIMMVSILVTFLIALFSLFLVN